MEDKNRFDKLRENCWDKAFYTFATAWIFEKRASGLRWRLKLLTFLGIAVPLALGGTIASFGLDFKHLKLIIIMAGILSITQLIGTLWAIVAKWQDEYAYSLESAVVNYGLYKNYKELGENPPQLEELQIKMNLLDIENKVREESDIKHGISEKQKRMGHRAALRQFQRACVACGEIPTSMKATKCDVCGKF